MNLTSDQTRDKFAEIHRERQTHAKNRGESLRRVWWVWVRVRRESSNTGEITAAESPPLAELGAFVTRTASPPSPPPEYLPTCPLVPLWLTRHRKQQSSNFKQKKIPLEHSSWAQEVWSAHVGCWWGEEGWVWEAIFQKKFFEERIQSLTCCSK